MGIKAKAVPTGDAHKNRCARASAARTSNAEGVKVRAALGDKSLRDANGVHPFGQRNRLLCAARKAKASNKLQEANDFAAKAEAIAPLTAREKMQIERL